MSYVGYLLLQRQVLRQAELLFQRAVLLPQRKALLRELPDRIRLRRSLIRLLVRAGRLRCSWGGASVSRPVFSRVSLAQHPFLFERQLRSSRQLLPHGRQRTRQSILRISWSAARSILGPQPLDFLLKPAVRRVCALQLLRCGPHLEVNVARDLGWPDRPQLVARLRSDRWQRTDR